MKTFAAILILFAAQGRTLYEDPSSAIGIYNYSEAEGGSEANGDFVFSATGKPLRVESRLQGLTLLSPEVKGLIGRGVVPIDDKKPDSENNRRNVTYVKSLDSKSPSTVTFDSVAQYNALVEHANQFKLKAPPPFTAKQSGKLETEELHFKGAQTRGVFEMPKPFTLTMEAEGKKTVEVKGIEGTPPQKVEKQYKNNANARGLSATVNIDPQGRGIKQIQSGTLRGRIALHMTQAETGPNLPTETTVLDGEADEMTFDLKVSRTITLSGNVKLAGTTNAYQGRTEADVAVITLNEALEPIKITFRGNPISSTLRERKPGIGGKK